MRTPCPSIRILIATLFLAAAASVQAATTTDYVTQPWTFNVGGGWSPVVGGLNHTLSDGWNFSLGVGYKLNHKLALNLEYMNNHLGVDDGVLNQFSNRAGGAAIDGSASVWSVTLNPKWDFELNHVVGGYLIGGGGYYHVRAQVTTPGVVYLPGYCDYYWGCWPGGFTQADKLIGERKDDTGGVNGGVGLTFNAWSGTQFYVEARYHYVLIHGPDLQLFPITFGFRY